MIGSSHKFNKNEIMLSRLFIILYVTLSSPIYGRRNPMEDPRLFEGDMQLTDEQETEIELAEMGLPAYGMAIGNKWPNPKEIAYHISESLINKTDRAKTAVDLAIAEFEKFTCLRFRPRKENEKKYIRFSDGSGCSSPVGYNARYPSYNRIQLGSGCRFKGIVIHEIMHSLGFWHEQSRPDRDKYVKINYENIKPGRAGNFGKYDYNRIDSKGSPYDYLSVMHYSKTAFSVSRKNLTIETLDPAFQNLIGHKKGLSAQDIWQVNVRYCGGVQPTTPPPPPLPPTTPKQIKGQCIRHHSALFVTVERDGKSLFLTKICKDNFVFTSKGSLQHTKSSKCMQPEANAANSTIVLKDNCGINAKFVSTTRNSLRHAPSGKCLFPASGLLLPKVGTKLVLRKECNKDKSTFKLVTLPPPKKGK